jgi:predicted ester cyclase
MSKRSNIELASRLIAAFETGEDRAVEQLIHPAHRDHVAIEGLPGPDGVRESIRSWRAGFTVLQMVPEDIIASDDRVVVRVRVSGKLAAARDGRAAIGRSVEVEEVHIWRVTDNRLVEHWMVRDGNP